jgi:hypothetical protein
MLNNKVEKNMSLRKKRDKTNGFLFHAMSWPNFFYLTFKNNFLKNGDGDILDNIFSNKY